VLAVRERSLLCDRAADPDNGRLPQQDHGGLVWRLLSSWHILMKGSIVAAAEGDIEAAQRAKSMARLLLDHHR
jgi:hypothetical protein